MKDYKLKQRNLRASHTLGWHNICVPFTDFTTQDSDHQKSRFWMANGFAIYATRKYSRIIRGPIVKLMPGASAIASQAKTRREIKKDLVHHADAVLPLSLSQNQVQHGSTSSFGAAR
jgi:hypothetical protein